MGMIDGLAAQGRNGDTAMAHVTPGEVMIPKEIAQARPDLIAYIGQLIQQAGGDPSKIVAGKGRRNPATGLEEFATEDEVKAAYQQYLGRDADAEGIAYWTQNDAGFGGGTGAAFQQGVSAEKGGAAAGPAPAPPGGGMVSAAPAPGVSQEAWIDKSTGATYGTQDWDHATNTAKPGATSLGTTPNMTGANISAVGEGAQGDIQTWYRNMGGRDPDATGLSNWTNYYNQYGRDATYQAIAAGMKADDPSHYTAMDINAASKPYTGYQSANGKNIVDEWARNNFGREATPEEIQLYGGGSTTADAQANYQKFVEAAVKAGGVSKGLDMVGASQLKSPLSNNPITGNLTFTPNTNSQIDAKTETIEGRLGNLLALDENGNYTNQVVRQAADRAMQQFAARGLRNSSMAVQAGQEAVIAKAIEIAGPDAERYFQNRRSNVDAQNTFARDEINNLYDKEKVQETQDFTARQDYQKALQNVSSNYQKQLDTINTSNMTPEDKSVAIAQITDQRDGELTYLNQVYSRMPRWQSEWTSAAVPTEGVDISTVTNVSMLQNIINDPAQPEAVKAKARAKLKELQKPAATPAPAAGGGMINGGVGGSEQTGGA